MTVAVTTPATHSSAHLFVQECGPLVGDKLVVEPVVRSHLRHKAFHLRRHIVLDEPELNWVPAAQNPSSCCHTSQATRLRVMREILVAESALL